MLSVSSTLLMVLQSVAGVEKYISDYYCSTKFLTRSNVKNWFGSWVSLSERRRQDGGIGFVTTKTEDVSSHLASGSRD